MRRNDTFCNQVSFWNLIAHLVCAYIILFFKISWTIETWNFCLHTQILRHYAKQAEKKITVSNGIYGIYGIVLWICCTLRANDKFFFKVSNFENHLARNQMRNTEITLNLK